MKIRNIGALAVCLLLVDRALKVAVMKGLLRGSFLGFPYPRFTLHENFGIALDLPMPHLLIIILSVLLLLGIVTALIWAKRNAERHLLPLSLITAGAASNLYDRLHFGFVIDVIEIVPRSIWNLADILILIGIILLLERTRHRRPAPPPSS